MHFASLQFLVFFTVVFTAYWSMPWHRARMALLLVASCAFYMSWNLPLIVLILFSASVDYIAALWLEKITSPRARKWILVGSIGTNLSLLAFFKYTDFLIGTAHWSCNLVGIDFDRPFFKIALPLGISFYTFETISYVVDVYRGRIKAVRNRLDYALYILFFPHLIAGPIVRPGDFLPQIGRVKVFNWNRFHLGLRLFLLGLCKKAIIADHLASVVDQVFGYSAQFNSFSVWIGVIAYAMQIYGDFSGYTDMAIGTAHMLGFKLAANFNMPYLAGSITEFWRRWHISLSSWLRDYLYISLGGNRGGTWMTYRNLMLTMLLGGLWHGASWTFVLWGAYHGALLSLHRMFGGIVPAFQGFLKPVAVVCTFVSVCVGWVFFRAQSFAAASNLLSRMFWPHEGRDLSPHAMTIFFACALAMILGHIAGSLKLVRRYQDHVPEPIWGALLAGFLALAMILLPEDGKAFIYFQF